VNAYKKEHNKWARELKAFFHDWMGDIPYCEVCLTTQPPIDIAHSKKRRFIRDRATYFEAAILCRKHHEELEFAGHETMLAGIKRIVEERCVQKTL
jgi:hypothetical protein